MRQQSAEVDLGNDSGLLPLLGWLLVQFGERLEVPSELVLVRRRIRAVRTLAKETEGTRMSSTLFILAILNLLHGPHR